MPKAAFEAVEKKVAELKAAINQLGNVVETNSFGLDEWCESLDNALYELSEDINVTEQE